MSRLQVHDVNLTGAGDPALVLANGFCTDQASWDEVVAVLQPAGRVVRFDHAGNPGRPEQGWDAKRHATLRGHAGDVIAMLRELALRDVVFVGHSMSGMIGALVAIEAPELVGHLVTIDASPCYVDEPGRYVGGSTQAAVAMSLALADANLAAWGAGFIPNLLAGIEAPKLAREYTGRLRHMRPDVARLMLRSIFDSDFRADLPAIPCPVTVVQSTGDAVVPVAVGEYMAAAIPRASLVKLDAAGHVPHMTHPELVAGVLRRVLDEARVSARA